MDLKSPVSQIPSVGPSYTKKLEKLGIINIKDLLLHIPTRYQDYSKTTSIAGAKIGETITIKAVVDEVISKYTKSNKQMQLISVKDDSGKINVAWFNQRYILTTLKKGTEVYLSGEVKWFGRQRALISPSFELVKTSKGIHTGRLVPVYAETQGLSSKWLRSRIATVFPLVKHEFTEILPETDLTKFKLIGLETAVELIHFPKNVNDIEKARYRLSFNELLFVQLTALLRKSLWEKTLKARELKTSQSILAKFFSFLPFELTNSQKKAIDEIIKDLDKPYPMNRLLEGDVGSGKTVVAAAACYVAHANGFQAVVMAPTQILAKQHYQTLTELLDPLGIKVGLVTTGKKSDVNDKDIIVGTHVLLHKKDIFKNVAVVIIDEQHRFGVKQREFLVERTENSEFAPDVLTMTATPIPRTVALTIYGDLDLSTLDELPTGRKKVTTWIVPSIKRQKAYKWVDGEIEKDHIQIFVVCPLIEESEAQVLKEVKAVTVEFEKIKKAFGRRRVALMHGRLKNEEKENVISQFKEGEIDILVTTPIIEVGIDVPNAGIIIIEAADRFGLAQLHQLRGRVGRSSRKSYCLLFANTGSSKSDKRLDALTKSHTGFELAEIDLSIRGPGEIFGIKQSGFDELKIANWTDIDLIKETRKLSQKAIDNPVNYKELIKQIPMNSYN